MITFLVAKFFSMNHNKHVCVFVCLWACVCKKIIVKEKEAINFKRAGVGIHGRGSRDGS